MANSELAGKVSVLQNAYGRTSRVAEPTSRGMLRKSLVECKEQLRRLREENLALRMSVKFTRLE